MGVSCKKYLKSLEIDYLEPDSVLKAIKQTLDTDFPDPEQKLYCIGYIIDRNKEDYIRLLKKNANDIKLEFEQYKKNSKPVETKNQALPKKRVIVVKKGKRLNG